VRTEALSTRIDWVIPTGGGYFFAPSIAALEMLST
jgi:deferrochelatase/peroxidase EfeB